MELFEIKPKYRLADLFSLVARLRDPKDGCPWDKVQTHQSIRQNFLEEVCEALEAIDRDDSDMLLEELGDVLLQVALHAEMEREKGVFDVDDVADRICKKLVLRHPHIFGEITANDSETVLANWEDIKRAEKHQASGSDAIRDVPRALPSLMRSQKVQKRAGYVGFDYQNVQQALQDARSELEELTLAIEQNSNIEEEIGDLLFAAVNVARLCHIDAELACERACDKFSERFAAVEQLALQRGVDMQSCGMDTLNELWSMAKNQNA